MCVGRVRQRGDLSGGDLRERRELWRYALPELRLELRDGATVGARVMQREILLYDDQGRLVVFDRPSERRRLSRRTASSTSSTPGMFSRGMRGPTIVLVGLKLWGTVPNVATDGFGAMGRVRR